MKVPFRHFEGAEPGGGALGRGELDETLVVFAVIDPVAGIAVAG